MAKYDYEIHTQPHLNFRSFVDALEKEDDLVRITTEVDPHLEAGAITRRVCEIDGPAVLFENVKGAKNGLWRILGAPNSLRADPAKRYGRMALHLGMKPTSTLREVLDKTTDSADNPPIDPTIRSTGPCKENIIREKDVDLDILPSPWIHDHDGGRYVQTYGK